MSIRMANVEVNRRAEGTSELNRRLGAVGNGAVALERCGVAGDYGRGLAGKQAQRGVPETFHEGQAAGQQQGAAGARGSGVQKPNRGLTFELTRPERTDDLPARTMMNHRGLAGKAAGRGGSALSEGLGRTLRAR